MYCSSFNTNNFTDYRQKTEVSGGWKMNEASVQKWQFVRFGWKLWTIHDKESAVWCSELVVEIKVKTWLQSLLLKFVNTNECMLINLRIDYLHAYLLNPCFEYVSHNWELFVRSPSNMMQYFWTDPLFSSKPPMQIVH